MLRYLIEKVHLPVTGIFNSNCYHLQRLFKFSHPESFLDIKKFLKEKRREEQSKVSEEDKEKRRERETIKYTT